MSMQRSLLWSWIAAVAAILVAGSVLVLWLAGGGAVTMTPRLPGGDGAPAASERAEAATDLAGVFQTFDGVAADLPGAWPRFRGAKFDNICADCGPLAETWSDGGPKLLWQVEVGEGYAGAAVLNGRVYMIDYDAQVKADAIRCFSLADGREIWRRSYKVSVKKNHGMSRTVPAVTNDYLVTMGPRCHVVCLDPVSGALRWGIDLQREYGTEEPLWYTGQCPLIEEGCVILAPCGPEALLMAVDCATGAPIWKTPNPRGWKMSHASIMPMTIAGKRMYVYAAVGGVVGVSAEPGDAGALLWDVPWKAKVIAPSPVAVDGDRVLCVAGYGEGSLMLRVRAENGVFAAETIYERSPKDGIACEQHTPIVYDGLLYAVMPKDAGSLRSQLVCYSPDGDLVWSSGQEHRFGLGPFLLADGKFYVLSDDGELTMARLSRTGYEPLAKAQVLQGHEAWGPFALAGGRLLLRDSTRLACIQVGTEQQP